MPSIVAVEAILRLALDPQVDTKVLRLVHGLSPLVAKLQVTHQREGEDAEAFIALGDVTEATGIGDHHTIWPVLERQLEQVGALVCTRRGRPGRFLIHDRDQNDGRGTASRWALVEGVDFEGTPLRWAATGEEVTGPLRPRLERLLHPASEAMRQSDTVYRVLMAVVASRGFGDVPLVARDLQALGWSRTAAYRALGKLRDLGWYEDGVLRMTPLVEDSYWARPPLARHRIRVREWIGRLCRTQIAWAQRYAEELAAWLKRWCRPLVVPRPVQSDLPILRPVAPLRT